MITEYEILNIDAMKIFPITELAYKISLDR